MSASQPQPLDAAQEKTAQVQRDLELASAELELAQGALERHIPPQHKSGDVAWALGQNAQAERKVQKAAEELEAVEELLEQARAQGA